MRKLASQVYTAHNAPGWLWETKHEEFSKRKSRLAGRLSQDCHHTNDSTSNESLPPFPSGRRGVIVSVQGHGWIKVHRTLLDHPRFTDGDWLKVWFFLLLKATHTGYRVIFNGRDTLLRPGQLVTSRPSIVASSKVERSKVERILKLLETEQQIEQVSCSTSRLITILNWDRHQKPEQPDEQRMSSERANSEQPVSTNKKDKKEDKGKKDKREKPPLAEIQAFMESLPSMNSELDAEHYDNHWQENDFTNCGKPIKNWRLTLLKWFKSGYFPSQKTSTGRRNGQLKNYVDVDLEWEPK